MWLVLATLTAAIVLFVSERMRVDLVALCVVAALLLSGVLTAEEAVAGFAHPVVLTIAALFVVGGAVLQTGLADRIARRILRVAGGSEAPLVAVIMLSVALLSAFMSDTGTVAVLLPAIVGLAGASQLPPSRLLIPLAYGSLLGGATTLIGTAPNLIASGALRLEGLPAFGFFSFTPIGLALLGGGIAFMLVAGRRLLPSHATRSDLQRVARPSELVQLYRLPDNLYRMRVRKTSELAGRTIAASGLRPGWRLNVLRILRPTPDAPAQPAADHAPAGYAALEPAPETTIEEGDWLVVQGEGQEVGDAAAALNLAVIPAHPADPKSLVSQEVGVAEVLLPPRSELLGKTIVETRFGSVYQLTVLGLRRPGVDAPLDLKHTELRFGDTLLVQGTWEAILKLRASRHDFVVMGEPESLAGAPYRRRAPVALAILLAMLGLMVADLLPVLTASLLAALAMVLSGCLTLDEAYESVDWKSIVLIAGMLPMSTAMEKVELVQVAAGGFTEHLGGFGPLAVLAGLFLLTSAFTQVLSNTATTVLIAPIALAAARTMGLAPQAYLMGVAIAASMAFASPVASPVNTLVMGAGSYRFRDYLRVGLPMIALALAISLLLLPVLFPL